MANSRRLLFLALFPFACGYFASQLLRAVNAVIAPELVRDFGIGPAQLGFLTSAYLLAFSAFQLPLGVMLDRYGPRRVQAALLIIAAGGSLLFAAASSFPALVFARAVIGLGFSAGLMASYKSSASWVPLERRALANALIMSAGALGIVVSTEPTSWLVLQVGWRGAFVCFAAFTTIASAFIFFAVPEKSQAKESSPLAQQFKDMIDIMRLPLFWRVAPMLALSAGIGIAYQTLWAGPWLRDVAGLSSPEVARHLFWMAVAFMLGTLGFGVLADRLQTIGISPMQTLTALLGIHSLAQLAIILAAPSWGYIGWLALAASGQCAILSFAWFAAQVGDRLAGRANATINFSMFVAAFSVQYIVGVIIGRFVPTTTGYAPESYGWAFGLFLVLQVASIIWYLFGPKQRQTS
jgi:predicted MFS family arabinose efflux permease